MYLTSESGMLTGVLAWKKRSDGLRPPVEESWPPGSILKEPGTALAAAAESWDDAWARFAMDCSMSASICVRIIVCAWFGVLFPIVNCVRAWFGVLSPIVNCVCAWFGVLFPIVNCVRAWFGVLFLSAGVRQRECSIWYMRQRAASICMHMCVINVLQSFEHSIHVWQHIHTYTKCPTCIHTACM